MDKNMIKGFQAGMLPFERIKEMSKEDYASIFGDRPTLEVSCVSCGADGLALEEVGKEAVQHTDGIGKDHFEYICSDCAQKQIKNTKFAAALMLDMNTLRRLKDNAGNREQALKATASFFVQYNVEIQDDVPEDDEFLGDVARQMHEVLEMSTAQTFSGHDTSMEGILLSSLIQHELNQMSSYIQEKRYATALSRIGRFMQRIHMLVEEATEGLPDD